MSKLNKTVYKNKRKQNKTKKQRRSGKRVKGGCKTCVYPDILPANLATYRGGSFGQPSFSNVPIRAYYGREDYSADVQRNMVSSRLMGGVLRRRTRKMRGGVSLFDAGTPHAVNYTTLNGVAAALNMGDRATTENTKLQMV